MNPIRKIYCRAYQAVFRLMLPILPYREPKILSNIDFLPEELKKSSIHKVLLVTDRYLYDSGSAYELELSLNQAGIACTVYADTRPNPTTDNIEDGKKLYLSQDCEAIIGFGGGSSIDCAKAIGAAVTYPNRSLKQFKGQLKVLKMKPLLVAVPTTAGTGSEVTLTAVITDPKQHYKYTMNSFPLIPRLAVLDPKLTYSLPASLTATTGMDALTHAIEAYIGRSTTKETRRYAMDAIQRIYANIEIAYQHPDDKKARAEMLNASYLAGAAFTRSYVGYVHAVAHSLGGQYGIPHGLANAVLLPVVLEQYGASVARKLWEIAVQLGICSPNDPQESAAKKLIAEIHRLNDRMGIPRHFDQIRVSDIPIMVAHADKEANPLYPVPELWDKKQLTRIYTAVSAAKQ